MADAKRDNNQVSTITAASNADGATPVLIKIDSTDGHGVRVDDNTTGSDLSNDNNADRDSNGFPVILGVSSADGITPVEIYADPATGKLLIDSN